jgi:protein-disulfide isomerase
METSLIISITEKKKKILLLEEKLNQIDVWYNEVKKKLIQDKIDKYNDKIYELGKQLDIIRNE